MSASLIEIYDALLKAYGRQHWWPGESPFEVMVGAVLTQNTNWANVNKAIGNLKSAGRLSPQAIQKIDHETLAELIRPSGYYNLKARRLKHLVNWLCDEYGADIEFLKEKPMDMLREELLAINGIGQETADSILLYALEKPSFVVDVYTYRVLQRHGCIDEDSAYYEQVQEYCQDNLPHELDIYNEFHALLVQVGKNHCKPKPRCEGCPLSRFGRPEIRDPD